MTINLQELKAERASLMALIEKIDQEKLALKAQLLSKECEHYQACYDRDNVIKQLKKLATPVRTISVNPRTSWERPDGVRFQVSTDMMLDGEVLEKGTAINTIEYYRFNGVLLHRGGGNIVARTPQVCSNEEWADMLAGNIPEKFFHVAEGDPENTNILDR